MIQGDFRMNAAARQAYQEWQHEEFAGVLLQESRYVASIRNSQVITRRDLHLASRMLFPMVTPTQSPGTKRKVMCYPVS